MTSEAVAEHYNAVPNLGLAARNESNIVYLRNLNNWVKSMLINDAMRLLREDRTSLEGEGGRRPPRPRVLDLCCGKGGDLRKWKIADVDSMVMADIAHKSMEDCRMRYGQMKEQNRGHLFPVQFIVADCADERLASKFEDNRPFDVVSCQFALHYAFETEQRAWRLLVNATESLRSGGLFIGTLPDANRILWCARQGMNNEFSNRAVTVSFADPSHLESPPLYGASFHFKLDEQVNLAEYVVHFPLLQRMLSELGCELVYARPFPEAIAEYRKQFDREAQSLLERMNALETFPRESDSENDNETEFGAARRVIDAPDAPRSVGTLSKSEWEAACLYLVFVFRKL